MALKSWLSWIIVADLLVVNWLAFHDIFEVHTLRDWLTLFGSLLVFGYLARDVFRKS